MLPPASSHSIGPRVDVTGSRRVLIACDKFKGALSAEQACDVIAAVLSRRRPGWVLDRAPLSDGGDGFCRLLTLASGGELQTVTALGPRFDAMGSGEVRAAEVGWVEPSRLPAGARELLPTTEAPGRLAIVEMASINGLWLVPPERRDVWRSSSYGTGELLRAAARGGAQSILLGVGGSATSDLGLGALCALGLRFEDARGRAVQPPLPLWWERIVRVCGRVQALPPLRIACDVQSPALGPRGAAAVFGPQKGLLPGDVRRLDAAGARMVALSCEALGAEPALADAPGAGAAGGIALGLMLAAGARLVPGFELVAGWLELDRRMQAADLVITGEGRFDASSWSGKGPGELAQRAARLERPCVVFAGAVDPAARRPPTHVVAISPAEQPLEEALRDSARYLERAVEQWLSAEPPRE